MGQGEVGGSVSGARYLVKDGPQSCGDRAVWADDRGRRGIIVRARRGHRGCLADRMSND